MSSRIDEKTMVPLSVVAALFTTGISVTALGAVFVYSVNSRLARIERHLGISDMTSDGFIPNAEAKPLEHREVTGRGPSSKKN